MPVNVSQQTVVFLVCILTGMVSGIIGDLLSVTAQKLRFGKSAVFVKDLFFWLISLTFFFAAIYHINGAVVRWYVFLGAFFGALLYMLLIRCPAVIVMSALIDFILKTTGKIMRFLLLPIKKMKRIFNPIKKYVQNIRKKKDNFVQKNIEKLRRIRILLKKV